MTGARGGHALVTGAASGIGRAVAGELGRRGFRLHLTDLDAAALDSAAAGLAASGAQVVLAEAADLTDHDAVLRLAGEVHALVPALDAVCNVAGIAIWGEVDKLSHAQWRAVLEVDLVGPISVIEAFVPAMIEHGSGGHLVNVSSAAGLLGLPLHAPYSAAKFGLRGVSEVLRFDLARHGIAVTLACPGAVDTPMADRVVVAGVDTADPRFARFRERFRTRAVSPQRAARAIVDGMLRRRYLVYTSADIRVMHAIERHLPRVYALIFHAANRAAARLVHDLEKEPAA